MFSRKRKASSSEEPACMLCGRADDDPNIFGRTFGQGWIRVHEFCLIFANIFYAETVSRDGTVGIPLDDIARKVKQANQKQCCVCGERGAAIACAESGCARSFHLPCAKDGQCITQFFGQHRSFCFEHHPRQTAVTAPAKGTTCIICLGPVGDSLSYHTLVCPACRHTWFHRGCIQQQALTGNACFRCPGCRDSLLFLVEMSTMGIQIPDRTPEQEDSDAYASLLQRHRRCDAIRCRHPEGREQADIRGPWQLILCSSCGAESTHRQCSYLSNTAATWDCDRCAGLGTASSAISELAALSTARQESLEPSHRPQEPEDSCSGPDSQAASGPSHRSQLPELSCQSREPGTEHTTIPSCLPMDMAEQHQGRHRRRQTAVQSAECCSRTSTRRGRSESSREFPGAACRKHPRQRGTSRTRSRTPLQSRASSSQSRPRRRHGSRGTSAPCDQSSTRRSARLATLRSSRASPVPEQRGTVCAWSAGSDRKPLPSKVSRLKFP
ncbi:PHD finger protein 7-like [Meleagris gallopavo]|uniref:PHD finger protein 7-like n=1 Tax=Meleagris gallopavo TaxID=9103 RepID=UPI00093AC5E8|nr:PHD finger protein 7-like [Meleagris gallopavo]